MGKQTRLAALAAVASLLAGCGGHGASPLPSTSQGVLRAPGSSRIDSGASAAPTLFQLDSGIRVPYMHPYRAPISVIGTNGAGAPAPQTLHYFGGSIQPTQKIYLVFWGQLWKTTGDPDKIAPLLRLFFKGLSGSQWERSMTQYYGPQGTFIQDAAKLAGSWIDTGHQPALHPTDAAIAKEATVGAGHFKDYSVNASYVIVMPHGHNPSAFGSSYCAYHNSETATGGTIAYTNLPYIPDAGQSCGSGSVNQPGTNDGVTIVSGHEEAETNTDPIVNPSPTGWYNTSYGEIGDICAWQNLQNTTFSTGTFPTQPLWSNKASACVQ